MSEPIKIFKNKSDLPAGVKLVDTVTGALRELLVIRNPELKSANSSILKGAFKEFLAQQGDIHTVYIYYPWRNAAVHAVDEDTYFELRTARNKNIITKTEQDTYRNMSVGIVGMSIGSNIVFALTFSGGPKFLRIADFDTIEISNLNRLRAPLYSVGTNKAETAARQVWDIDPFAQIDIWPQGVDTDSLAGFVNNSPALNVFVDEMDDLGLKILSRTICRERRVPVVMATNNGDNVILDVERFDLEPERAILHGLVRDVDVNQLSHIPYPEWVKIATQIVDPKNLTKKMQDSIAEIGKSIAAVPQLGTTATIAGAAAAYAIRKISIGETLNSGRYFISLDKSILGDD